MVSGRGIMTGRDRPDNALLFLSVCSGIEAASVALTPLGFKAVGFSEIEPFPAAVLKYRYPDVPNYGNMLTLGRSMLRGEIPVPDLLIGGTPCQSYSLAGHRKGLDDERGQLTRTFAELAQLIDRLRAARGLPPCWVLWENVPGVLSSKDNAFGYLLAGLVGETQPLEAGKKWPNAGMVAGPRKDACWRVLDAQYFGLAQMRKRVFLLAGGRPGTGAAARVLLPVEDGRCGSPPPSRPEKKQAAGNHADRPAERPGRGRVTRHVAQTITGSTHRCRDAGQDPLVVVPDIAWCLQERDAKGPDSSTKPGHLIPVCYDLRGNGNGVTVNTLTGDHPSRPTDYTPAVCVPANGVWRIRRLTELECERLCGFPDNWTLVPWKRSIKGLETDPAKIEKALENCPATSRYRAIGNTIAVPVLRWIGERLKAQMETA